MKGKLIPLKHGSELPKDFWNYAVNPITGYYIEKHYNYEYEKFKYGLRPLPNKQQ